MEELTHDIKKDIFSLYIGAECIAPDPREEDKFRNGYITGIHGEYQVEIQFIEDGNVWEHPMYSKFDEVKILLKPLYDIDDNDAIILSKLYHDDYDPNNDLDVMDDQAHLYYGKQNVNHYIEQNRKCLDYIRSSKKYALPYLYWNTNQLYNEGIYKF